MTPVEQLQADVLGPRYKDKRVLLEFTREAESVGQLVWTGTMTAYLVWEKPNEPAK